MIIGLTGPICAGIDSCGRILEEKGFVWFSYSDIVREEARKRGIKLTRVNLQGVGDALRKKRGNGVLSEVIIAKIQKGKEYVIGNMRNPGEVEVFRKHGDFILVKIDAPFEIRHQRMVERDRKDDVMSRENFKSVEARDFGVRQEAYGQQHAKVFSLADVVIVNDKSIDHFRKKIEKLLVEVGSC